MRRSRLTPPFGRAPRWHSTQYCVNVWCAVVGAAVGALGVVLAGAAWPPTERPHVFVCGPTQLVEAVATDLVGLGHEPARVKTERFGPTGD